MSPDRVFEVPPHPARRVTPLAFVAALSGVAACADPSDDGVAPGVDAVVGVVEDPGDTSGSLYAVRGTVTMARTLDEPDGVLEVGVLWLNLVDGEGTVLLEATPADVIGDALPAAFEVALLTPPSDAMLGTALVSYGLDGSSEQPVDRDRVGFGVVVVAPAGTLAELPATATLADFIGPSTAEPGVVLGQFTYVSPYTVRYVKGATAEGLTIRDINGVESTLEDLTTFDVNAWARGIDNSVCRDRFLGEGWTAPEVVACIGDSTDANVQNQCLYDYMQANAAVVDERCGVQPDFAESDFRNSRKLAPDEPVTLPLDEGDIREALTHGGFVFLG